MSIEAMALVLHHSKASGTAKVVLLGVANHEGDGGAHPAVSTLAKYANVDPRSVRRHLEQLVEAGELAVIHRAGSVSTYRVLVRCPKGCDRTSNHRLVVRPTPDSYVTPDESVTPDVSVSTPLTETSPHPGHRRQGTPDSSVTQTVLEPSLNRPANRSHAAADATGAGHAIDVLVEVPPATTQRSPVQALVGAYVERCSGQVSSRMRAIVGREIKRLVDVDRFEPAVILAAIEQAAPRGRTDLDRIIAAPNGPAARWDRRTERQRMFARWDELARAMDAKRSAS